MRQVKASPGTQKRQLACAPGAASLLLTGCPAFCLALAGWNALVLPVFGARIAVTVPAGFAVSAFLFSCHFSCLLFSCPFSS